MIEYSVIPKSWKPLKLGEVCKVRNGYAFKSVDFKNSGVLLFRQTNLDGENVKLKNAVYLPEDYLEKYQEYKILKGDVLVGMSGSIGKMCVYNLDKPALQNQRTGLLRFTDLVEKKFIRYYFEVLEQVFIKKSKGVAVLNISAKDIQESEFHLPPLPEQQAIVAKIEELLSELENGRQQLQTAQQQLKVYRHSLLKYAFEGRLTNKNVKDGELPKGWKIVELKNIVERISDGPFGSNLKSIDYVGKGIRVIRLENIGVMEFRDEYKTYVTPEKYETIKRYTVGKGDIIFSSFILDSVRSVILPEYIEKAINKADCFLVRADETKMNKKFLAYYFSTKAMQNQLVNQIHGATRPRINTTQLKASLIPFAPLKEQQLIVDELESKLTVCDKIEETITNSLLQAETLRQSILKKAFEGKLV
jgi:type I restriction enzyme S subunit